MISMLLWQTEEKQTNKSKHSIWFSRIYKILYFIQFYPPQTTIPHDPSSKLYFRMWNYYCGKLQLCWKLYCQPVKYKKNVPSVWCMNDLSTILYYYILQYLNYNYLNYEKFWFKKKSKSQLKVDPKLKTNKTHLCRKWKLVHQCL